MIEDPIGAAAISEAAKRGKAFSHIFRAQHELSQLGGWASIITTSTASDWPKVVFSPHGYMALYRGALFRTPHWIPCFGRKYRFRDEPRGLLLS
jgi:hypothetical protein